VKKDPTLNLKNDKMIWIKLGVIWRNKPFTRVNVSTSTNLVSKY